MEHSSHPSSILDLEEMELHRPSRQYNLKLRDTTIQRLLYAAKHSLSRSKEELAPELLILKMKIQALKKFNENILTLEKEMETLCIQTTRLSNQS